MQRVKVLEGNPRAAWWLERLLAALALGVVVAASLAGYHPRTWQDSGSDFKTVYASGKCFLQGLPAYSFESLGRVFQGSGLVPPMAWYAHAPIYPPFTFVALAPVLALPMVTAAYVWMALSALALIVALWAMAGRSEREFGLPRRWRLLLIVLLAANPLVSFGLQIGNMSVMATALCLVAVMATDAVAVPWLALALAFSLLLKPHIAVCLLAGMLLSREAADRAVARRAMAYFGAALACFALMFSFHHPLGLQLRGFAAMLQSEIASGSMNPANRQWLPIEAEITSLESLLAFFGNRLWLDVLQWGVLAMAAAVLIKASRAVASGDGEGRLEVLGAWSSFGLLLTYHRSHDGIVLLLLLPWMLLRWRRQWLDPVAWTALLLLGAMGLSVGRASLQAASAHPGLAGLAQLVLYRQAPLATLLLMLLLLTHLAYRVQAAKVSEPQRTPVEGNRSRPAMAWASRP